MVSTGRIRMTVFFAIVGSQNDDDGADIAVHTLNQ
jgi:hypothetical protein